MHVKAEGPFLPSILAREEVHRILSTGSVEFCGGETAQMLAYLDRLTPTEATTSRGGQRQGLWLRLSSIFRA